jgi:ATP-dependent exoDNAse (exonuclease V) beta subunit
MSEQLLFGFAGAVTAAEPTDASERRRALDPQRSFIVQAPAGSGKTELLIQRYLTLLARVAVPEQVVAITFTVKAAAEMRARVLQALELAEGPAPGEAHALETWELARQVVEQDGRLRWGLRLSPARMQIQTIDALSMSIVRQMPWTARMGAMPDVTDDARLMYESAAEKTVRLLEQDNEYGAAVDTLLRHLDYSAASARDLIAEMLSIRDHWLPVTGVQRPTAELRKVLEARLAQIVTGGLERLAQSLTDSEALELTELARYAAGNLEADHRVACCRELSEPPGADPRHLATWRALSVLLLTAAGDWRTGVDRRIGFPTKTAAKDRFERLLRRLRQNQRLKSALDYLQRLPDPCYSDQQWQTLEAVFTLLPRAVAELRVIFGERGVVDFTEITQAALAALGTPQDPTDLALVLDHRIEHLLIDEFQDTSRTQETLLRILTAGWDGADGRTLFLVGDPMQSIYRFRQAEVGIFLALRSGGLNDLSLEPVTLSANFRSAAQVVGWNNARFRNIFPEYGDPVTGAVPFSPSTPFRGEENGSGVYVHPIAGRDDARECAQTVQLIEESLGSGESVAVLVRARTHLLETAARLRERGIAFRAIEIDTLGERAAVQDLLALTRALLHPGDRPAWLAILRAPWCGMTLADLEVAAGDGSTTIWERISGDLALSEDGARRLSRLRPILQTALARRGRMPLRALIEGVWAALEGPACLGGESDSADVQTFLQLLEGEERGGDLPNVEEFARKASELFSSPNPAAPETLELMTIHRAKGLEFDRVIVPGLGRGTKQDEAKLLLWSESGTGDVLLAPIAPRHGARDSSYDFLNAQDRERTRYETARVLYVACTRARRQLHLIGHVRITEGVPGRPESGSFLEFLWPEVKDIFQQLQPGAEVTIPDAAPPPLRRLAEPGRDFTVPESDRLALGATNARSDSGIPNAVGVVMHRFLERIANDGLALWSADRVRGSRPLIEIALRAEGLAQAEAGETAVRVEQALIQTLGDERGRWILERRDGAQNEYAVASVVDGAVMHLQIDRTFVDANGIRWVIDYKTGNPEEADEHWPQLERYAAVLREFEPCRVGLGLYFPFHRRWITRQPV